MKLYSAPMEGVTGFAWRKVQKEMFGGVDRYYAPFVSAGENGVFKTREIRDLTQNEENLVPQIMANKAEYFIWAAKQLHGMGFDEFNFNLGCPSGTVVSKAKGSGALKDLQRLDQMLDGIFEALPDYRISVKTRIGLESKEEWPAILEVYEKYPIYELTIHSRPRVQMYTGKADRDLFKETLKKTKLKLVYNGDVELANDEAFSYGCNVMAGRGLVTDPSLFRQVRGGKKASRKELLNFHEAILASYGSYLPGDDALMKHMKEFWFYYSGMYQGDERLIKKPMKAKKLSDYLHAAEQVMREAEMV